MDLEKELLEKHTRHNTSRITEWIGDDESNIELLIDLFLNGEYRVVQRSSWIVSELAEKNPELFEQYLPLIVPRLVDETVHIAVKRNVVRLLQFVKIPEDLKGFVLDTCFSFLENPNEGNAVQAFSITIIEKFTSEFPEIIQEFKLILERNLENGASPAFKSRARKTLNRLS